MVIFWRILSPDVLSRDKDVVLIKRSILLAFLSSFFQGHLGYIAHYASYVTIKTENKISAPYWYFN